MKKKFTLLSFVLLYVLTVTAQNKIQLVQFSSGYSKPIDVENCGDSRLFIVQQQGKILICDSKGVRNSKPFLNISDRIMIGGEQGLLGLAFDPDYATNGFFYVNYIDKSGNTQVSRFKVKADNPNVASKGSEKFIINIPQPFNNHNGGCTRFGPDGYLYIGMGDGGSGGDPNNNAQNPMSLLGKLLRIDVHHGLPYKIPAGNPFVDSSNYRHEIWALGLRNPWRWSFDALNGNMIIADVGQSDWEELDLQPTGKGGNNYGWHCYEGSHIYDTVGCKPGKNYIKPVYQYDHSTGDCSVIGGFIYRGSLYPSMYGRYIFTDYCSGVFRTLYVDSTLKKLRTVFDGDNNAYTSFGEDVKHELYVCSNVDGIIYHITDGSSLQNNFAINKNVEPNKLSVSPNPSNGTVNISYASNSTEKVRIVITSMLGQKVLENAVSANAGTNNWNLHLNIPKGNYYLSILNSGQSVTTQSIRIE